MALAATDPSLLCGDCGRGAPVVSWSRTAFDGRGSSSCGTFDCSGCSWSLGRHTRLGSVFVSQPDTHNPMIQTVATVGANSTIRRVAWFSRGNEPTRLNSADYASFIDLLGTVYRVPGWWTTDERRLPETIRGQRHSNVSQILLDSKKTRFPDSETLTCHDVSSKDSLDWGASEVFGGLLSAQTSLYETPESRTSINGVIAVGMDWPSSLVRQVATVRWNCLGKQRGAR
jgi:hypothetical protein